MTNAAFQPPKPYLVMWDINISSQYNFSYLTPVSFPLFPLLKAAADRQVFIAGAVWQAHPAQGGSSAVRRPERSRARRGPAGSPVPGCASAGGRHRRSPGFSARAAPPRACSLFSVTSMSWLPLSASFGHWTCLGVKV